MIYHCHIDRLPRPGQGRNGGHQPCSTSAQSPSQPSRPKSMKRKRMPYLRTSRTTCILTTLKQSWIKIPWLWFSPSNIFILKRLIRLPWCSLSTLKSEGDGGGNIASWLFLSTWVHFWFKIRLRNWVWGNIVPFLEKTVSLQPSVSPYSCYFVHAASHNKCQGIFVTRGANRTKSGNGISTWSWVSSG